MMPHLSKVPLVEFDKKFVDIKMNISNIEKASLQNPTDIIPSIRVKVLKNVKNLAVSMKLKIFKEIFQVYFQLRIKMFIPVSNTTYFDKSVSFCPGKSKSTSFMIFFITMIRELGGVQFKCALKTNETLVSKAFSLSNNVMSFAFNKQNDDEHAVDLVLFEQKSPPHIVFRVIFYNTKVKID